MGKILKSLDFGAVGNSGLDDLNSDEIVTIEKTVNLNRPSIRFTVDTSVDSQTSDSSYVRPSEIIWWFLDDRSRDNALEGVMREVSRYKKGERWSLNELTNRTFFMTPVMLLIVVVLLYGIVNLFRKNGFSVAKEYENFDFFDIAIIIVPLASATAGFIISFLTAKSGPKIDSQEKSDRVTRQLVSDLSQAIADLQLVNKNSVMSVKDPSVKPISQELTSTKGKGEQPPTQKLRKYSEIFDDIGTSKRRVLQEISDLNRRGIVNLTIGGTTSVVAAAVLLISLFDTAKSLDVLVLAPMLNYYIPRISIVVFVEIFAFFFLRLYRNNLSDIKYYQNEMTNLDSKYLALKTALSYEDEELVKLALTEILKTERNFILRKGETTISVESEKLQDAADRSFIEGFKSAAESLSGVFKNNLTDLGSNGHSKKGLRFKGQ